MVDDERGQADSLLELLTESDLETITRVLATQLPGWKVDDGPNVGENPPLVRICRAPMVESPYLAELESENAQSPELFDNLDVKTVPVTTVSEENRLYQFVLIDVVKEQVVGMG